MQRKVQDTNADTEKWTVVRSKNRGKVPLCDEENVLARVSHFGTSRNGFDALVMGDHLLGDHC